MTTTAEEALCLLEACGAHVIELDP
jgi:hypothetical protein